jgi:hypothetical protein
MRSHLLLMPLARLALAAVAIASGVFASAASTNMTPMKPSHPELGRVSWHRGHAGAREASKRTGLPLLVLFDEVPGCSTVQAFGAEVLSHPLIVEAAETLFVPVAVFNNTGGEDRMVLERFHEPSWNNPVVRILDGQEQQLAPRLDGDYTVLGLASTMREALRNARHPVPAYLELLIEEERARAGSPATATFAMHCFWEGEVSLGAVNGVLETKPGFAGGREVVRVTYDRSRLSQSALASAAEKLGYRAQDGAFRYSDGDNKYQLRSSPLRFVPMTEAQKAKVNSAVGRGEDPAAYLSPRQRELLERASTERPPWPALLDLGVREAFERAEAGWAANQR